MHLLSVVLVYFDHFTGYYKVQLMKLCAPLVQFVEFKLLPLAIG